MEYIKNIEHEKVILLKNEVMIEKGQIVSKTLTQNEHASITLFAFAKSEEISTHESEGDAFILVLEGTGKITIDGTEYILTEGNSIVMPAKKPHAVFAQEDFKMLLTVIFP